MPKPNLQQQAKAVFMDALERPTPEQRDRFLDEACQDDSRLRGAVNELLASLKQADSFMEDRPGAELATATRNDPFLHPGNMVGPYKLQEKIGEGGMGSVWVARQSEPIKRTVAIKLIKAGMDSKSVLARFEAERQALAMMDHPNIARVLDGGITDKGRPYFAMEYVKGVPLIQYCDDAKLSVKQRLELFMPVCKAVQHAHQKGVIHRDLKPSNVLVCLYDGKPVPKVIDFGLAKAIHQPLTDQSVYTAHGIMLGTPLYMSPEQAEYNNLDIDTRSDIYSLGVILYELLTGSTPLEKAQVRDAAANEVLRLIKESEPPKPSTKLSGSESLPNVAAQRGLQPEQLTKSISGDLDWVVMKALEKERSRRYETANGLAEDIRRHLEDETVSAGPPSTRYRLQKFIKRNRAGVVTATAVSFALLLGIVGTTAGMFWALSEKDRANDAAHRESVARKNSEENARIAKREQDNAERELARAEEIKRLVTEMFESIDPKVAQGSDTTLLKIILADASRRLASEEITDELVAADLHDVVGRVFYRLGLYADSIKHHEIACEIANRRYGPESHRTLNFIHNLSNPLASERRYDKTRVLLEATLEIKNRVLGTEHIDTLKTKSNLAVCYYSEGRLDKAEELYQQVVDTATRVLGPEHQQTVTTQTGLAKLYAVRGRLDEAERILQNNLEIQTRELGKTHPDTLHSLTELGFVYHKQGQHQKSEHLFRQAVDMQKIVLGEGHPITVDNKERLAIAEQNAAIQTLAEAEQLAENEQWNRAADGWVHVIKVFKDNNSWFSPRKSACLSLANWSQVFDLVVEQLPEETTLWIGRGQSYAQKSQWKLAASDYKKGVQSRAFDDESMVEYAGTLLLTNDQAGYESLCKKVAASTAETNDSWSYFVSARTCGIGLKNEMPAEDLVTWAEMRLRESSEPWDLHVMGLALYRADRLVESIKYLEQSNAANWGHADALNWLLLSMCHYRQGNVDKANESLDQATARIGHMRPQPNVSTSLPPIDWIEWHVLYREAAKLLQIPVEKISETSD